MSNMFTVNLVLGGCTMIYLDHASTTKPTQSALNTYLKAQEKLFFNSESIHQGGVFVQRALDHSRHVIQTYFQCDKDVIFTTTGSEANRIAISMYLIHKNSGTIWVSPYEHPSIFASLSPFEKDFKIRYLPLDTSGEIDVEAFKREDHNDDVLIIMQHVNSETGYRLPVESIGEIANGHGTPMHVDGIQAVLKVEPLNIAYVSSYSVSGHKFGGSKGAGFLLADFKYIKPLNTHFHHEYGMRNGTLDVPSILAMVKVLEETHTQANVTSLNQLFREALEDLEFKVIDFSSQSPYILGVLTPKFEGQFVMQSLSSRNIYVSTGTACGHGTLMSKGLLNKISSYDNFSEKQYLRISLCDTTRYTEIKICYETLGKILKE